MAKFKRPPRAVEESKPLPVTDPRDLVQIGEEFFTEDQLKDEMPSLIAYNKKQKKALPRFRVTEDGKPELMPRNGRKGNLLEYIQLSQAIGVSDVDLAYELIRSASNASCGPNLSAYQVNLSATMIHGIGPKDELEAMLAAQMVASHNAAMTCLRTALASGDVDENLIVLMERGARMMGLFTRQMEALKNYRGKGEQKVTVEHVHVHAGGQAVVGSVSSSSKGGGGDDKEK